MIDLENGFIESAEWADRNPSNVWHECVDDYNGSLVDSRDNVLLLDNNKYNEYAAIEQVKMWAHISDLLPKNTF